MSQALRCHRRLGVLGVVILVVITTSIDYGIAATRAEAALPGQQSVQDIKGMGTLADGASMITDDQEHDLICVKSRQGRGMSGGCGRADSPSPMVSISGGTPSDPAQMVVVDAQRRIAVVRAVVDGKQYDASPQDGGFSVQMTTTHIPDELSVFDTHGNTLYASQPGATSTRSNQAAKDLSQSGHQ